MHLLNPKTLRHILEKESDNLYYKCITNPAHSFFSAQKGEVAYNFEAKRRDGSSIKLSDLKGKLVFIDNWATWCGPCRVHRPHVIELAEKYKDNSNITFLYMSLDEQKQDWFNFLEKESNPHKTGLDLIISFGQLALYRDKFNIGGIPQYMLIDEKGIIINAHLSEPSQAVEQLIEEELERLEK